MPYISKKDAKTFQHLLNLQGADLLIDGIIGPLTKAAIDAFNAGLMFPVQDPTPVPAEDGSVEIKTYGYTKDVIYGEESEEVKQLQAMLKYQGFGKYLGKYGIDGKFGYGTRKGIEEYVRGWGLNTPAIEKTDYRAITQEIWEMFHFMSYDIENSIWTDEYMRCNCNGQYCDGTYGSYGVSYGLVLLILRLEEEVKQLYGSNAKLRLTDDIGYNGGLRCEPWNKICGGAKYSTHIKWLAADLYVSGVRNIDYIKVQQLGDTVNPYGGCSERYTGRIHIDSGGYRRRW